MSEPLSILFFFLVLFGIIYGALILHYTIGWFRLKNFTPEDESGGRFLTVIIPARDEANNILNILQDLKNQSLAPDAFEIIVVDDHSTDGTASLVESFHKNNPELDLKLIRLMDDQQNMAYKKHAIQVAIGSSEGEIIVTTDGDCRVGDRWLETVLRYFEQGKTQNAGWAC